MADLLSATQTEGDAQKLPAGLHAVACRDYAADVTIEFEVADDVWVSAGTLDETGVTTLEIPQGWRIRAKTDTAGATVSTSYIGV